MRYRLSQDLTCTAPAVWGLVYKFICICYRSLDRIFDIVYWPVISLLLWGFTSTFVSRTSSFSGVMEFFLGGAVFLVWTDAAARVLIAPTEIPVGVLTALCGGPFFIFLLRRQEQGREI